MNDIKPVDNLCPKCEGFYVWEDDFHRCLCCGYVYNPQIIEKRLIRLHCTWGACVKPVVDETQVYCDKHNSAKPTTQALFRRSKQLRNSRPSYVENQIYLNRPIPVRPIKNESIEYEGS